LTFYPGTANVNEAQPITLAIGQEFGGLNFGLVSVRLARVSGTARDSEGRPVSGQAFLLPRDQQVPRSLAGAITADGNFTITNVPPGEYNLDILLRNVSRTDKSAMSEFASMPVTLAGADITGLRIATSRGAVVSGRVTWDGSAPRPGSGAPPRMFASSVSPLSSTLAAATDPDANGRIDGDGTFQIGGVSGRFLLTANIAGWSIRSVRLDGREITTVPIDAAGRGTIDGLQVVMTDKSSMLAGAVTDARGDVVTQYVVVLQPADDMDPAVAGRFVRAARPDTNGRFEFRDLRAGRYVATAIEALEPGRHFSPDFQRALRRGAREFSVREGEALTLDLKLTLGF
jgi:hypothetical protein